LIKPPEHTWGLPGVGDWANWANDLFQKVRHIASYGYMDCEQAWLEQRLYNDYAVEALGNHPLASTIKTRLAALKPQIPSTSGYALVTTPATIFDCPPFRIGFSPTDGSVIHLSFKDYNWASPNNPLAQFVYSTYNEHDFTVFINGYANRPEGAAFIKPNISAATPDSKDWTPGLKALYKQTDACNFLAQLQLNPVTRVKYGGTDPNWVSLKVNEDASISIDLQWFGKITTRLPESFWFTFNPVVEEAGGQWLMDKIGTPVDPLSVLLNGSQYQHGVWDGVRYTGSSGASMTISSLDAGIVSPGKKTPFPANPSMAPLTSVAGGMNFNLYNNIWNTNYILWYPYADNTGDDAQRFRFVVKFNLPTR